MQQTLNALQRAAARFAVGGLEPMGYSQITAVSAAVGITPKDGTSCLLINVEAQAVRWRDDGIAPTATVGMMLAAGDFFTYTGDPAKIKFIETSLGAILNIVEYR